MDMRDVKAANKANGHHFFSADTMAYWDSKIESGVLQGRFFITSEQTSMRPRYFREFKIREIIEGGKDIRTIGDSYTNLELAKNAIERGTP